MREGRARPGGRSGTELGLVLAGLVLLHGIAGIISLFGAEAGADIILQMFGLAAVRSTIAADAESASDTAADIALTEGAPGVSGGSGHAAAEGGGLAADGTLWPEIGRHPPGARQRNSRRNRSCSRRVRRNRNRLRKGGKRPYRPNGPR